MTKELESRWIKGQDEKWHEIDSSDRDYDQGLSEKPVEAEEYDDDEEEEREFDEDKELAEQDHMDKWSQKWFGEEESSISVAGPPADSTIPANSLYVDDEEEEPIGEVIESILNEAEFREEDHPRDGGKFTTKGGGDTGKKEDKMTEIWNDLDPAQRGGALEDIFPPTEEEKDKRWSLRSQHKNANTDFSELSSDVKEKLIDHYKARFEEPKEKKADVPKAEPKKEKKTKKMLHSRTGSWSIEVPLEPKHRSNLIKRAKSGYKYLESDKDKEKVKKKIDNIDNLSDEDVSKLDMWLGGREKDIPYGEPPFKWDKSEKATERDFYTSNKQIDDQAWEIMAEEEFGKSVSELNDAQYDWIDQIMHDYGNNLDYSKKPSSEGIEEENLDDAEMWIGAYDTMGMSVEDINNKLKGMAIPNDTINKAWDNYKLNPTKNRNFESKANENEGWWECENCSAIAIKDEDKTEHEQDTGHTMYHAGFKPVVPLFHESKASESVTSWWGGRGQSSLEFRSKVLAKAGVYEGFQDKEFWEMPEYAQDKVYELYAGGYVGEAKLKSGYIQCPDCDQQFSNLQYLSDHMDERHKATEVSKKEWESASTKEKETMLEDVGFGMMSRPEGEVNSLALKKWEDLPRETKSMWGYYESYASEVEHDECPHCNFETSWKEGDLMQEKDAEWEMSHHIKVKHGESHANEARYEVTIQGMDGGYFKTKVDAPDEEYAVYQARNQALTEKGEGYYDDTISFVKGVIRVGESHSDEQEVDLLTQLLDNELEEEEQGHDETEDIALITQLLAPESYSTKKKLSEFEDSNRPVSPNSLMRYTEPIDLPTGKNALDQTYGVSEPETPDGQDLTGVTLGEELTDEEFKKFRLKQQRHDYDLMTDKELEDEDKIFRQMSGDEEIIEKKFTPPKIHFYKQYPFGRRAGKQNPFGEATEQVRLSTMDRAHTWWDRKHPDRPWRDMRIGGRQRAIMAFLNDPDTTVAESYSTEDTVPTDTTNICPYCEDFIEDPNKMIKHIADHEANEGGQGSGKNKEPHHIGWKNYGIDDYIEKAEKEYEEKSEEGKWDYVEGDNGEQEYGDNLERARIRMDAEKELLDKTEHARFPVKGGMDYQEGEEQEEDPEGGLSFDIDRYNKTLKKAGIDPDKVTNLDPDEWGEERVIDEPRENMSPSELGDWQQRRHKEYEQDQKASDYLEKIKYSIDKGGAQFQRGGEDFGEWDNDESPMSALDKEKYELEGARHDMQMQKNFRNPNEMDKEETGFDWQKGGEQLEDPTPWASLAQLAGTTVKDILFPSEEQAGGGGAGGAGGAGAGGTGATGGNGTGATGNGGEPPTNGNGEDEEQPSRRIGFFGYGRRRKCPEGKVYRNGKCVEAGEEKSFSDMTEEEMEELGDAESSPHTKEDVAEEGNDWIEDDLPNYIKELRNDLRKEGMLISEDDIITNIERKYNINRSIATDYLLDYYKKGNEGGKGSGKKDHKQWMIAIEEDHTYDFCENCSMITEQVNHKCAMCGKKVE